MTDANVISRNTENDLALLQLDIKLKSTIKLNSIKVDSIRATDVGTLLLSAEPESKGVVSVLGTGEFILKNMSSIGYLGAASVVKDGKLILSMVQPTAAASEYLKVDDQIISVDNINLSSPESMVKTLQKYHPGDLVQVSGMRGDEPFSYAIKLRQRPSDNATHVASRFDGGRSTRYDGFTNTFVHDGVIKPDECGSPLFDINGRFIGITMARYSRTSSIATAARGIQQFVASSLNISL